MRNAFFCVGLVVYAGGTRGRGEVGVGCLLAGG
jgi:hypothetical protein